MYTENNLSRMSSIIDIYTVPHSPMQTTLPSIPSVDRGRLEDGREFFVYRFLLYNDGFSPFSSKMGSMDGCYILPLGIPPDSRTSSGAIRRLWLTPPGVSSRDIFSTWSAIL